MIWQIAELKQMLDTGWMYVYIEPLVRTLISRLKAFRGGGNGQLFEKTTRRRREDRAKDVSSQPCVCGFWFSFCLASWSTHFFSSTLFTSSTPLKDGIVTESWCGSDSEAYSCIYPDIYVHSFLRLVGARGDTEQHYFYFKFLFLLLSVSISARWEPKSMKFYFCCEKLHTGKW